MTDDTKVAKRSPAFLAGTRIRKGKRLTFIPTPSNKPRRPAPRPLVHSDYRFEYLITREYTDLPYTDAFEEYFVIWRIEREIPHELSAGNDRYEFERLIAEVRDGGYPLREIDPDEAKGRGR
jgi:hypothetical protein